MMSMSDFHLTFEQRWDVDLQERHSLVDWDRCVTLGGCLTKI